MFKGPRLKQAKLDSRNLKHGLRATEYIEEENTYLRGMISDLNNRLQSAQDIIDDLSRENTGYRSVIERYEEKIQKYEVWSERLSKRYDSD